MLGDIGDPRYLVRRTDGRLPSLPLTAVWLPLRTFIRARVGRPTYPVPDVLGVNRASAEAFAAAWRRHVGGGELVYTATRPVAGCCWRRARSPAGRHARSRSSGGADPVSLATRGTVTA